ncbi:hypothetical protein TSTA_071180 [Talaromyces stipitatus ATCC 10500]|uniref:MYND-type domain-containing protein n=1 Tax=Talaromyces stipitatus (strain ATCC 10500 / CBS 375.48 / QM 6759 / NRRL 1006) TaxID=441959 RepID=B8LUE2_TALSN|nr:uncharacterized protein TSTA_071180 [Talaromyces stipitatus ATCC 10500]EED23715.1 hypothetical protein TSTA_071180 [Talaromyces stipitatus ATCC 10500]
MDFINQKLARLNSHISPRKAAERAEVKEGARRKSTSKSARTCTHCKKREPLNPRAEQKLKRCARCRSALYCSRACQRADWKRGHQRACSVGAIMVGNSYLESLPTEEAVMDQLVDAYRLRVEDEKMYCGRLRGRYMNNPSGSDHDNDNQVLQFALQDFRDFLDLAECPMPRHSNQEDIDENNDFSSSPSSSTTHDTDTNSASSPTPSSSSSSSSTSRNKDSILPKWWNAERRTYCEQRAMNQTEGNTWSSLLHPATNAYETSIVGREGVWVGYNGGTIPLMCHPSLKP